MIVDQIYQREACDLVLKNARVLNVFTKEWIKEDVAISKGMIVGLGTGYRGKREADCTGKYIIPGLIDAHMHIESTLLTCLELSKILVSKGTTTVIADPHEMVNVKGKEALDYLIKAIKKVALDIYLMMPSSVPSTDFETNGAGEFLAEDMKMFINEPRIIGLAEAMRFDDVMNQEKKMMDKIDLFSDQIIDGHAPGITGLDVQAYRYSGVQSDHECSFEKELLDKIRAGFMILIREGSQAHNEVDLLKTLKRHHLPLDRCCFCTDDKHIEDIMDHGHISYNVKLAIDHGIDPIEAILMATYYPARFYGLKKKGALFAGAEADIVVLSNLSDFTIEKVYKAGILSDECINEAVDASALMHTVKIKDLGVDDLSLEAKDIYPCIQVIKHQLLTKRVDLTKDELRSRKYDLLCVCERHGKTSSIQKAILLDFGLENAAIASTVAHDSHNLICAGDNEEDMVLAINTLKQCQGGYCFVSKGKVLSCLPLPICGLMSDRSFEEVRDVSKDLMEQAHACGIDSGLDPFQTLSFLSLCVIPEIRLSDRGVFDVLKKELV